MINEKCFEGDWERLRETVRGHRIHMNFIIYAAKKSTGYEFAPASGFFVFVLNTPSDKKH